MHLSDIWPHSKICPVLIQINVSSHLLTQLLWLVPVDRSNKGQSSRKRNLLLYWLLEAVLVRPVDTIRPSSVTIVHSLGACWWQLVDDTQNFESTLSIPLIILKVFIMSLWRQRSTSGCSCSVAKKCANLPSPIQKCTWKKHLVSPLS